LPYIKPVNIEMRRRNPMLRACSLLGLAAGFLIISPALRETLLTGVAQAAAGLDKYSPYSYAGVALALLGGLVAAFSKGTAPR
jgi:hypothetical protein